MTELGDTPGSLIAQANVSYFASCHCLAQGLHLLFKRNRAVRILRSEIHLSKHGYIPTHHVRCHCPSHFQGRHVHFGIILQWHCTWEVNIVARPLQAKGQQADDYWTATCTMLLWRPYFISSTSTDRRFQCLACVIFLSFANCHVTNSKALHCGWCSAALLLPDQQRRQ